MPADAHAPISVGAVNASGRPEPYSATGPALDEVLSPRPETFLFDELSLGLDAAQASAGTSLAAALAAGTAASAELGDAAPSVRAPSPPISRWTFARPVRERGIVEVAGSGAVIFP